MSIQLKNREGLNEGEKAVRDKERAILDEHNRLTEELLATERNNAWKEEGNITKKVFTRLILDLILGGIVISIIFNNIKLTGPMEIAYPFLPVFVISFAYGYMRRWKSDMKNGIEKSIPILLCSAIGVFIIILHNFINTGSWLFSKTEMFIMGSLFGGFEFATGWLLGHIRGGFVKKEIEEEIHNRIEARVHAVEIPPPQTVYDIPPQDN